MRLRSRPFHAESVWVATFTRRTRVGWVLLGICLVVPGCGLLRSSRATDTLRGDRFAIRVTHPRSWRHQLQGYSIHYSAVLGYLATFKLHTPCHSTRTSFG